MQTQYDTPEHVQKPLKELLESIPTVYDGLLIAFILHEFIFDHSLQDDAPLVGLGTKALMVLLEPTAADTEWRSKLWKLLFYSNLTYIEAQHLIFMIRDHFFARFAEAPRSEAEFKLASQLKKVRKS